MEQGGGSGLPSVRDRLDADAASFLLPYLEHSGATAADLDTIAAGGGRPPFLDGLRRAEGILGPPLLRSVLGALGWPRLAHGLSVETFDATSVDGSFPFVAPPAVARLLARSGRAETWWRRHLLIAHGSEGGGGGAPAGDGAVQRFRSYNVAHAELLDLILAVAPLDVEKVARITALLERVVVDFSTLFRDATDDARRVGDVFARLRAAVEADLARDRPRGELSGDTVRRVQAFEDPPRLDDVTTLHGLKRYLHQRGLRLAFRLFGSQAAANRTVDLLVASDREILRCDRVIRYLEFEPTSPTGGARLPFAVSLLAEALGFQLLHGRKLPWVTLLGYGNELQVYVHYRNHPAFLRIDLSPPFRGGLLDLEYFGVSQYELDQHPDLSLQGVQRVLRELEFDVTKQGLRLHARYDKERAVDLGDVVAKARALFRLLPHLMEIDWSIGDLDYPAPVREVVAAAWARFFARWGVLPIPEALSRDRRKILVGTIPDAAGPREILWDGVDRYRDRFTGLPPAGFADALRASFEHHGLKAVLGTRVASQGASGQCALEQTVLAPLRSALARGQLVESAAGIELAAVDRFAREHEAIRLATLLAEGGPALARAIAVAQLARSIERQARFLTTGSIDGYPVQAAVLPTAPSATSLFVLRDDQGMIRLALASAGDVLYRTRARPEDPWELRDELAPPALMQALRAHNYLGETKPLGPAEITAELADVRERFRSPSTAPVHSHASDDRILPATSAAPGWAAGFARFDVQAALPGDLRGAVLVASAVRPENAAALRPAAALVSTGGGILSHVGLIALELGKPAVIVEGRWSTSPSGAPILVQRRPRWDEQACTVGPHRVVCRHELHETEDVLEQGDLVAVDADAGHVVVLGHDPQVVALHQGLYQLASASGALSQARSDADVLSSRGALIRAAHQLERLLARIDRPPLVRHAIRELLSCPAGGVAGDGRVARSRLVATLLRNRACAGVARHAAEERVRALRLRLDASCLHAAAEVATLETPGEILFLRLSVWRMYETLRAALHVLEATPPDDAVDAALREVDRACRVRLERLRGDLTARIDAAARTLPAQWRLRHLLPKLRHVEEALSGSGAPAGEAAPEQELRRTDLARVTALRDRRVLPSASGGLELRALVGGKAAHLGEIARVLGEAAVPPWFVVTDAAFRAVLALPPPAARCESLRLGRMGDLHGAIAATLARGEWDARRQAAAIRELWLDAALPEALVAEIEVAHGALGSAVGEEPLVAIRSSTCEEDGDDSAWAGQFDTFLFVRGIGAALEHLKLAWAGFWTERAILQRRALGVPSEPRGGGVLVQRMVSPRAAGVLHTVSAATGQLREMVVIAGLGVGEGIVSGTVDVDTILVSKDGDLERGDPRVRYRIGDKREQLVLDGVRGSGVRRVETRYHQRFRAALEYVELKELVRAAHALERAFLSPLDVEFAVDGQGVRILQARPVALFETARRESMSTRPLLTERGRKESRHDPESGCAALPRR